MEKIKYFDIHPDIIVATTTKALGSVHLEATHLHNYQALAGELGVPINRMVAPIQKHTTNVKEVFLSDGGTNIASRTGKLEGIDALICQDDLVLLSFHADCTPIILYCADKKIIASIHSGWKGTVTQITSRVMKTLINDYQVDPAQIHAFVGPSLSYHHLEVKQDVVDQVSQMDFDTTEYIRQIDKIHYLIDNKGLNARQLANHGVLPKNITVTTLDTFDDNDLFSSHRMNKDGTRNVTLVKFK